MAEQDHTLQVLLIVRVLRIAAGQFPDETPATGHFDLRKTQLKAFHIIGKIVISAVHPDHLGQYETLLIFHHHIFLLVHNCSSLFLYHLC